MTGVHIWSFASDCYPTVWGKLLFHWKQYTRKKPVREHKMQQIKLEEVEVSFSLTWKDCLVPRTVLCEDELWTSCCCRARCWRSRKSGRGGESGAGSFWQEWTMQKMGRSEKDKEWVQSPSSCTQKPTIPGTIEVHLCYNPPVVGRPDLPVYLTELDHLIPWNWCDVQWDRDWSMN